MTTEEPGSGGRAAAGASRRLAPPGVPLRLTLTLLLAGLLPAIASTGAAPTLPLLADVFADTPGVERLIPLVLTLSPLAIALSGPGVGYLIDRWGRRPVLLLGAGLYALAGSSAALAPDLRTLLSGRFLLGIAVCCILTAANTVIGDLLDGAERARYLALQAGIVGFGASVLIVVSGLLAGRDWRLPFLLSLLAIPLVPMVRRNVPGGRRARPVVLPAGTRPQVPTLPTAITAVSASGSPGYLPSATRERPVRGPSGRLAVVVATIYVGMVLLQATYYLVAVQLPFLLRERFGAGPGVAGGAVALLMLAYALGAVGSVRVSQTLPATRTTAVSLLAVGVGYAWLGSGGRAAVVPAALIAGLGFGVLNPNLLAWLAAVAPAAVRGRLFGGLNASLFLGQFVSPFLWAPAIAGLGRSGALVLAGAGSAVVAGAVAASGLLGRRRGDATVTTVG
jgi:hypothetical protein